MVDLGGLEKRKPAELSGGQQQLLETFSKAVRAGEADLTLKNGRSIVGLIRGASSQT
jgi:ABC-type sulfate/molybdate transport systems ATPase subunit